jgi:TIR domain-containing protein
MKTEQSAAPESMLCIVHAAADRDLAILLRARIKDLVPGVQVFLASKAGELPTGEDWLAYIHKNLKAATSFLLLLTPRSVDRHWVSYEAGVAWSRGCRRLPVGSTVPPFITP